MKEPIYIRLACLHCSVDETRTKEEWLKTKRLPCDHLGSELQAALREINAA